VAPARRPAGRSTAPVVTAAVDVGSNSVHLLVAVVGQHRLEPLVDESVFLGLGTAADRGVLGAGTRASLVAALLQYGEVARRLGAKWITFVGTEPMRRAVDAAAVVHEVERASGLPLHVLGHEEEALLTLIGVTAGRAVRTDLAVVDVGGGSSEVAAVGPGRAAIAFGVRVGSARLTERFVEGDPPSASEVSALRAAARELVATAPDARIRELVAVGGTASNLLKVLPAAALDRSLTRRRLADATAVLMAEPSQEASERHAINPVRARVLPAGAAILEAIMGRYGLDRLHVSEASIREGTAYVTAHAGACWRDRLGSLAHGWDR
jgi:exopolyphosphatase/guanosine-5'-triphosphate,3'-diphosphate pyrophosphatase